MMDCWAVHYRVAEAHTNHFEHRCAAARGTFPVGDRLKDFQYVTGLLTCVPSVERRGMRMRLSLFERVGNGKVSGTGMCQGWMERWGCLCGCVSGSGAGRPGAESADNEVQYLAMMDGIWIRGSKSTTAHVMMHLHLEDGGLSHRSL